MDEVKRMFKPEFLNRIDDTIVFHPLTKDHMKEIVTILLNVLAKRTKNQMSIRLNAGDDVKEYLVEKGYDEKYGDRLSARSRTSSRISSRSWSWKEKCGKAIP